MLLAEAVALTESPRVKTSQEQDAQIHSPLFFEEEVDLATLRGSEVATEGDTSVENTGIPGPVEHQSPRPQGRLRRSPRALDDPMTPVVLTYRLPMELVEVTYAINSQNDTGSSVSQRLRDLYQSSLIVKSHNGKRRRLR